MSQTSIKPRPILSICIPTYNRAEYLDIVLSHYVNTPEFDETVEIVISDNASPDNTKDICDKYIEAYPNIRYYRNEENIKDANFPLVLGYARGEYLKLMNDCLYLDTQGLKYIKDSLSIHLNDRKQVFFTNDYLYTKDVADYMECSNLDEYVQRVSTFVTSNNCFGCWKDDWDSIQDKRKYAHLQLQQDDWTYQLMSRKKECVIFNKQIFLYPQITKEVFRTPYNWFQVHLDNYYLIMKPYIDNGEISQSTYNQDKKYLLNHFEPELIKIYFRKEDVFFESNNTFVILRKYYSLAYLSCFFSSLFIRFWIGRLYRLPKTARRYYRRFFKTEI